MEYYAQLTFLGGLLVGMGVIIFIFAAIAMWIFKDNWEGR
jgi:uncharacterized membrane protein